MDGVLSTSSSIGGTANSLSVSELSREFKKNLPIDTLIVEKQDPQWLVYTALLHFMRRLNVDSMNHLQHKCKDIRQ
ncbi:hypothetical protein KQX54_002017 [Cotesia glomerata]|uniref:Uncharacterized protein n=1 Tax=Cotesia glomerata TaxID=32391 RepID=A0AAV7II67_COTGL|nr:hypothetical protein KQX54_002017 [Cotesia glomerata]